MSKLTKSDSITLGDVIKNNFDVNSRAFLIAADKLDGSGMTIHSYMPNDYIPAVRSAINECLDEIAAAASTNH